MAGLGRSCRAGWGGRADMAETKVLSIGVLKFSFKKNILRRGVCFINVIETHSALSRVKRQRNKHNTDKRLAWTSLRALAMQTH